MLRIASDISLLPRIKRPEFKADHSSSFSFEDKNASRCRVEIIFFFWNFCWGGLKNFEDLS
jgi:hypothetical protein